MLCPPLQENLLRLVHIEYSVKGKRDLLKPGRVSIWHPLLATVSVSLLKQSHTLFCNGIWGTLFKGHHRVSNTVDVSIHLTAYQAFLMLHLCVSCFAFGRCLSKRAHSWRSQRKAGSPDICFWYIASSWYCVNTLLVQIVLQPTVFLFCSLQVSNVIFQIWEMCLFLS